MFGAYRNFTQAYRQVGLETGIAAARPIDLILMLYDGAIDALTCALTRHQAGAGGAHSADLTRAIRIIDEGLSASLDPNGGAIGGQLRDLYGYMTRRLLAASLSREAAPIEEVRKLLGELRSAWSELAATQANGAA